MSSLDYACQRSMAQLGISDRNHAYDVQCGAVITRSIIFEIVTTDTP